MFRRVALSGLLAAASCCSKSEVKGGAPEPLAPPPPSFTVFALAEVRGQIGPCGCTSDPLGDLSRTAKLVAEARAAGPVLVVDAGSLLYSRDPVPAHLAAQEELKADLLASVYQKELAIGALGLGPADLVHGPGNVRLPRVVANLAPGPTIATEPSRVIAVGGAKVGVLGVIAQGATAKVSLTDPVIAGTQAVAQLRAQGAQVVIALVQAGSKKDAVKIARAIGGIDLTIAGLGTAAPEPDAVVAAAEQIGDGWLVVPANRGQVVSRLDVYVRPPARAAAQAAAGAPHTPLADAVGRGAARARIVQLDRQLAELDRELAKFGSDASADPAFLAAKRKEREGLVATRKRLEAQPLVVPTHGSYFTLEQIRINKSLACSTQVRDAIQAYDRAAGEANVRAAAGKLPPAPPKGQAAYVGNEACSDCHQEAVDMWKTTRHAGAWKTLVDRGQQFDYECIGCHVTGWDRPGGANLAHNEPLRDVGCETCHGPGSIHVAKGGEEKPLAIVRNPDEKLCATQCHTKEHSDTFEYAAYMRDVLGPGHGEDMRKRLGDGATGRELRSAALDKAGRELGAGCVK